MPKKTPAKFDFKGWLNNFTWSRELIRLRPHERSEALALARMNGIEPLGLLLAQLEKEAKKILDADPPSFETFTPNQENAAAMINHVAKLRTQLDCLSNEESNLLWTTTIFSARASAKSRARRLSNREVGTQIALEAIALAVACIAGDFWTNLWPKVSSSLASLEPLKRGSAAGVAAKKIKYEPTRIARVNACCELALKSPLQKTADKVRYVKKHWKGPGATPSDSSIRDYLK